jgi:hypothetical protein
VQLTAHTCWACACGLRRTTFFPRWLPPTHPGRVFLWVAFPGPPTLVAFFCGFTALLPQVVAKKCNPASNSNDQEEEAVWALLDELLPTR